MIGVFVRTVYHCHQSNDGCFMNYLMNYFVLIVCYKGIVFLDMSSVKTFEKKLFVSLHSLFCNNNHLYSCSYSWKVTWYLDNLKQILKNIPSFSVTILTCQAVSKSHYGCDCQKSKKHTSCLTNSPADVL